ncbi:hypothetical protein T484DRAFT_1791820, partial [Baffinella frigidus]
GVEVVVDAFLNTNEPFCFAAVGVQGAGKSHTLACVLEGAALVLHYDQSPVAVCEAMGLLHPAPMIARILGTPVSHLSVLTVIKGLLHPAPMIERILGATSAQCTYLR